VCRMIPEIVSEIQRHGIRVELRSPVSLDEDLGRISASTIEVIIDPVETITAFTLCHLFGHMIQFTSLDRYRHLIEAVSPTPPVSLSPEFWRQFYAYEREAFGYGECLLEQTALADSELRSQYANFMELDFEHFRSYVSTGKRLNRRQYRGSLLKRYRSNPSTAPIESRSLARVEWWKLAKVEARIY